MVMNRQLLIIFIIVFTNLIGAGVVIPTLPLYAEGRFAATATQIGLFISAYHLAQFLAAPVLGQLSDWLGRKPVLVWSQVGTVASFLLFIYAEPISAYFMVFDIERYMGSGLFIIFLARALDGITGGNITAAQAYVTDVSTEENRAFSLGFIQSGFALGLVFGPAFGGFLAAGFGLRAPFVGAAVITGISLLITILFLEESVERTISHQERTGAWRGLVSNGTIGIILALGFSVSLAIAMLAELFPLFVQRVAFTEFGGSEEAVVRNVSLILTYVGLSAVASQLLFLQRLIKRIGERNVIVLSIVMAWITCVALTQLSDPWVIMLFLTPAAFGYAVGIPTGQSLLTRFGDEKSTGILMGVYNSINSLAYVVGPLLGGYLMEVRGARYPFGLVSVYIFGSIGLALWLKQRQIPSAKKP